MPAATQAATTAPMEQPIAPANVVPVSCNRRHTPTCAKPLIPPPPSTSHGRGPSGPRGASVALVGKLRFDMASRVVWGQRANAGEGR